MEMMLEVAIGVMNIEVVDMVLKFPYEDFTYVMFGFQDHHSNHDWTHGERRSQDHCFKINPQLANIVVAPDCKDDGEDGDGEDGDDGEDDGINVNVGKDHSIVIQELDAVPYYE